MFGQFFPQENHFFDFFEKHAQCMQQGIAFFAQLLQPGADIIACAHRVKEIEHTCDKITHQCVEALHKTFITPIDRDDIYRLISKMDDIIDNIEATAERMVLYDIHTIRPEIIDMTEILRRCIEQVGFAVMGLRSMKNTESILQTCMLVNQMENEADALLRGALARIFREESDVLLIIKWKEIFEYLEHASDCCEDVVQIVEGVVLENA
jgi:predicted phosphate transport protein (TIGR00153 family)